MSDFSIDVAISRSQMASALSDNDEQAMWVIGELATVSDALELAEYAEQVDDPDALLKFLDELNDAVRERLER